MIFRLYHILQGAHVHCRLFSGTAKGSLGKCGDLVMREEEFKQFKQAATFIQFREDKGRLVPHHGSGPDNQ